VPDIAPLEELIIMRRRVLGLLAAGAMAAAFAVVGATPAYALTWTASPGGAVTGNAGTTVLTDTSTGTQLTCASSRVTANVNPTDADGIQIATINTVSFTTCRGPAGITFTVSATTPWHLNANSYNPGTGVTNGTVTNIRARLSGFLCSATVTGSVSGTFTNSTDVLQILTSGSTLVISSVSGCFGLIRNGDGATFSGAYTITPGQTITSP
jgi:hypothetical protein